jgi:5-methylcytosine-specific restriction endonuclease McrA
MRRKDISNKKRQQLLHLSGRKCEYCLCLIDFIPDPYTIEHIIPIAKGGTNEVDNLAIACFGCNLFKQNKTTLFDIVTEQEVRLFNPRKNKWNEHFSWNDNFTEIIGTTAIGRVTVNQLKLNRTGLINIRKLLVLYGEHPPT